MIVVLFVVFTPLHDPKDCFHSFHIGKAQRSKIEHFCELHFCKKIVKSIAKGHHIHSHIVEKIPGSFHGFLMIPLSISDFFRSSRDCGFARCLGVLLVHIFSKRAAV